MSAIVQAVRARLTSASGKMLIATFLAAVVARLGHLALAVLLARQVGPDGYGVFTFAVGLATLGGQMSGLGWPTLMNRLIPGMLRDRDWPKLKGLVRAGDRVVLLSALAVAGLLVLIGESAPHLRLGLRLSALLIVPFAFAILRRQQLAAMRRAAIGLMFDQGIGAIIVAGIILIWGVGTVSDAVVQFALATGLGLIVTTIMFRRRLPAETRAAPAAYSLRPWMVMALPMVVGLSSKLLMNKMDILLLAPLSNMHEVGLYGSAFRVTYLLTFPQVVLMTVVTPLLSQAFTNAQPQRVSRLLKGALIYALATSVPVAAAILLFSDRIMTGVFGAEFAASAPILVILTVGQVAASLAIPFSAVLMMGGRERAFGGLNLAALGMNFALNLALVPGYGAWGSAVATMISAISLLVGQVVLSRPILAKGRS